MTPRHSTLAYGLMTASGFAGLAYQIVWTQQSTSWLGHESAAVLAVVAAFFGGLAAGALIFSSRIDRSMHPARWYAAFESIIALWSVALVLLRDPVSSALLASIGPQPPPLWHWAVTFFGTFVLLLPATLAMGATLPAMERLLATQARTTIIGNLYAANTFGAVLGVLTAAFWLVPQAGLTRTAALCAGLNLSCAVLALCLPSSDPKPRLPSVRPSREMALILAATGLLGIGYEVLVVRALSQVAENTVYTFAILLAVYLVGTASGAFAYARWLVHRQPHGLRIGLLQALATTCLLGMVLLPAAEAIQSSVTQATGGTMAAALLGEGVIAMMAFLPPTVIMGALFSHLTTSARREGTSFGHALGVNTLGAASAPMLFGVLIVPWLGSRAAFSLIAAGYLAAAWNAWRTRTQWALLAATLACALWVPSLFSTTLPPGSRLIAHSEGVAASVSVIEDASGVATLHINNRQQEGSTATLFSDARQALLPIALHSSPRRALFLGVGTGLTASSATLDPLLQVDAVELVPEVIDASAHFAPAFARDADMSGLRLLAADARRFVRTTSELYDVIVSDNFHPARSGSASLYTVEHFELVRQRLAAGGLFCQWLPLHQLDLDTLRSIVRSFLAAYPQGSALLATNSLETPVLGLISHRDGERFDLERLRHRLQEQEFAAHLDDFGIHDELALLGTFVAGSDALSRFSAGAPLNTDDRPIVAYRAPHITYEPRSSPGDRLIQLLQRLEVQPPELLSIGHVDNEAAWLARLSAYWSARERFIEAGRNVRPSADVREMLAQVRDPLLSVLQVSPDFEPAYDPLVRMASALGRVDPNAARSLLTQLRQLRPSRHDADQALLELDASP